MINKAEVVARLAGKTQVLAMDESKVKEITTKMKSFGFKLTDSYEVVEDTEEEVSGGLLEFTFDNKIIYFKLALVRNRKSTSVEAEASELEINTNYSNQFVTGGSIEKQLDSFQKNLSDSLNKAIQAKTAYQKGLSYLKQWKGKTSITKNDFSDHVIV